MFNFASCKKVVMKYKYMLLTFFVIIIFFHMFKPTYREGLTVGMYDFLDPTKVTDPATWSLETRTSVAAQMNKHWPMDDPSKNVTADTLPGAMRANLMECTEAEAQYYGQNGIFPYCGYVLNYYAKNPGKLPQHPPRDVQTLAQFVSNLDVYQYLIYPDEKNSSPPTPAALIFTGKLPTKTTSSNKSQQKAIKVTQPKNQNRAGNH
jgi:hypothetical protein